MDPKKVETHTKDTAKGKEIKETDGQESGRQDTGMTDKGRPTGESTARDATGINPEAEEPIDPASPTLIPG